jgi:undecaprenyl-diphosphatase
VVAWGALAFTLRNSALRIPATVAAALLIGGTSFGRIYLGVHWPSDVLGGLLLAGAWLTGTTSATLPPPRR